MLSVILVPLISIALIIILILLLRPSAQNDPLILTQLNISKALSFMEKASTQKDMKKLDFTINKSKDNIETAAIADIFDVTIAAKAIAKAREISYALTLAKLSAEELTMYMPDIKKYLTEASDYIEEYCGISKTQTARTGYRLFSYEAKRERAKKHLEALKEKHQKEETATVAEEEKD